MNNFQVCDIEAINLTVKTFCESNTISLATAIRVASRAGSVLGGKRRGPAKGTKYKTKKIPLTLEELKAKRRLKANAYRLKHKDRINAERKLYRAETNAYQNARNAKIKLEQQGQQPEVKT